MREGGGRADAHFDAEGGKPSATAANGRQGIFTGEKKEDDS